MSDILIVDDERDIRELISDILEDEGFATRLAGNSDDAIAAINSEPPSVDDPGYLAERQPDGWHRHSQARKTRQPRRAGGHHIRGTAISK